MGISCRHIIQGWSNEDNQKLKEDIMKLGVPEKDIEFLTERKSRSFLLNKAFKAVPQHYKYICLYDSDIVVDGSDFVKSLSDDLDKNPNIGCCIVPSYQFAENEIPFVLEPPMPVNSQGDYLRNVSFLTTFNVIMFRRSLFNKGLQFEESLYGSQLLDVDIGAEINRMEFDVVADLRHCLAHKQSDFAGKNLFYHAVVARNRNILREKWLNREQWKGVDSFNLSNPDRMIPGLEELSHSAEDRLMRYVCSFDGPGFKDCWLNPRFKDLNAIHGYYNGMVNLKNNTPDRYKFASSDQGWGFGL